MPNSVTKRSSRLAILAVVSVIASLFAFAVPASAATGDVEEPADWSACVNAATEDAGFTDTAGSFADAWIDCIAHYGITTGTTATTYSPAQVVTRAQMALFLTRAAGPAGIAVPAAASQGFTDIAGLPQTYQDAINQIKQLGITTGTSATTYSPNDPVSRYQMALFLIRFLGKASVTFTAGNDASGFTDTGAVSFEAFNAIEDAYDAGITTGTTATTFSPFAAVTREQMAAFIGRTLGHTNARPAGISFQVSDTSVVAGGTVDVQIAVRDANQDPVVDALVDVFHIATANAASALNANGTCTASVTATLGGTACAIVLAEPAATNASGNYNATWTEGGEFTGSSTFWAWTGAAGSTFDLDTTAVASVAVGVTAPAASWKVTTSIPANSTVLDGGNQVKYGTAVTHTFQLVDANGAAVATAGVDLTLQLTTTVDGALDSVANVAGTTDASGKIVFSLAAKADPNTGTWAAATATDNESTVSVTGVPVNEGPAISYAAVPNADPDVTWNDDPSVTTTVVASSVNDYVVASDSSTGASNTATATVYDQYGLGRSGRSVSFTSAGGGANSDLDAAAVLRTTNASGVATVSYLRDDATSAAEAITATADAVASAAETVYWVIEETDGATQAATGILVADADNDTIVLQNAALAYVYVNYDSNDQFNFAGATTYAAFDADIADGDIGSIAYNTYRASAANVSSFTGS